MSTSTTRQLEPDQLESLLSQPHVARSGREFVPIDDRWDITYQDELTPPLNKIEGLFEENVRPYFRLALARFAGLNSPDSVLNVMKYLSMIVNDNASLSNILDPIEFISLRAKRGKQREYQLSTIRGFLRYWHASGLWGVSDEFMDATSKLVFKGNEKGRAVKESCPFEGPYTPIEMQGILGGINNAYGSRKLGITDYLVTKLLAELGVRRRQASELVFGDFCEVDGQYKVEMPRGKQRGVDYRGEFTTFPVSDDLYHAVGLQKEHVFEQLSEIQSETMSVADRVPVFPRFGRFESEPVHSPSDITPAHHETREFISERLRRTEQIIDVHSERTGLPVHLSAARFRRTLGTDLHREGYGIGVIATALDHNDDQNAGVYTETTAEVATRLDMRIGKALAPMAQAFAGVIVKAEDSAFRGDDPTSRIRTQDGEEGIGNCGEMGFCGASAPVACYTCVKFQPWLDAPHEEVAAELYEEREKILAVTKDETMAGVLDRQILAVEDVINRCQEMRRAMESEAEAGECKNG